MKISGLVKSSVIDYPEQIAAVIFTQGCNFRCGFCHNPDLLDLTAEEKVSEGEFFAFLEDRKGLLDGVVITGGEPTLQLDLVDFIRKVKKFGFLVKLDTNGSNPEILGLLISEKLIDYVAMDVKGPLESYLKIAGYKNTENIKNSIEIIKNSDLAYEFRTTVLPYYHQIPDFEDVGRLLLGAKNFTVQGFRPEITYEKALGTEKPFTPADLEQIAEIMKKYVDKVKVLDNQ